MNLSIYDLEARQEGQARKDGLIDMTSAMLTMTVSFVFCAVFVAFVLAGFHYTWSFMFFVMVRTILVVGIMLFTASIIANLFQSAIVRRVNAMVLGMIMAFALIFMNI